ncbi:hypothetical protein SAY87_020810 [Trapa incisa]|uniref:Uncharacterized protein n=1 Tax=Trapa incisa TaxID=236973 RepID=A0AAN7PNB3_9MYRT|nr:hypothetical protein SAY87_020810 [Trapa incisa]
MDTNAALENPRSVPGTRVFPKGLDFGCRNSPSFSSSRAPLSLMTPPQLSYSTSSSSSSGVPFSWEKLPGIPKRQTSGRRNNSAASLKLVELLPLPPSVTPRKGGRRPAEGSFGKKGSSEWDPFVAALVECSKDNSSRRHLQDGVSRPKVCRSISNRFGFFSILASCKRTCKVDGSLAPVPRPRRTAANCMDVDP